MNLGQPNIRRHATLLISLAAAAALCACSASSDPEEDGDPAASDADDGTAGTEEAPLVVDEGKAWATEKAALAQGSCAPRTRLGTVLYPSGDLFQSWGAASGGVFKAGTAQVVQHRAFPPIYWQQPVVVEGKGLLQTAAFMATHPGYAPLQLSGLQIDRAVAPTNPNYALEGVTRVGPRRDYTYSQTAFRDIFVYPSEGPVKGHRTPLFQCRYKFVAFSKRPTGGRYQTVTRHAFRTTIGACPTVPAGTTQAVVNTSYPWAKDIGWYATYAAAGGAGSTDLMYVQTRRNAAGALVPGVTLVASRIVGYVLPENPSLDRTRLRDSQVTDPQIRQSFKCENIIASVDAPDVLAVGPNLDFIRSDVGRNVDGQIQPSFGVARLGHGTLTDDQKAIGATAYAQAWTDK